MQRSRLTIGLSSQRGIAAALLLLMTVAHVSAQSPDATLPLPQLLQEANASSSSSPATTPAPSTVSTTERIPLASGEIVEIMGADTMLDYTWTFSRDGVFLGATRGKLFRTRVVQPGTYSLKVDATDAGHTVAAQREFLLDVSPIPSNPFTGSGVPVDLSIPSSAAPSLVVTQPSMQDRVIAMPGTTVLRVSPSASDIATIDIDTNAAIDTDGNGNAQDDADTFDTFFHQAKNALYLWFPAPLTLERPLRVLATMQDGQQQTLDLIVATASGGSNATGDLSVQAQPTGDSTYLFTLLPAPPVSEGNPLLFEWSFGDGGQSLLEQPTHTYAQRGTYLVTVSVRSLTTGRTAGQGRTQVTASGTTGSGTAVVSGATSSVSTPDVTSTTQKSGWLRLALRIALGILVVGGLFGGLLWAIFRILRKTGWRSRLDNALDKGFETNASGNPKDVIDVPAAPLSLRRTDEASTPPKAPAAKPAAPVPTTPATATPAPKPAATSPGSDSPAPAWLQKGLATTSTTPVPTPPPPTPLPTSPAVSSEPQAQVQPQPAPATPLPPIDGTEAPAWLKRGFDSGKPASCNTFAAR